MNIEAKIVSYLNENGFETYADVPNPRPKAFVTVERTGGTSDSVVLDRPTVAVQAWAATRYEASELMLAVDACMAEIATESDVTSCRRNSMYNYPDGSQARYQAVYDLVTYKGVKNNG